MISHLTNTVTFMTNLVGESRHVGHSIIRFKSIYFYAINSLVDQIYAYMQILGKHFILIIQIDIYMHISQIESKMSIKNV